MTTVVTLFAGGGLKSWGAKMAGCDLVSAIEYDEAIAGVYAINVSTNVTCARVQDVDYRQWAGVYGLMMSPPCPNFSVAKSGGEETDTDIAMAEACCRAIHEINPKWVMLENVWGYRKSVSFSKIVDALMGLGYTFDYHHVNSADVGVPQTRMRLILRAVRVGWLPSLPPKVSRWTGWYEAIADLIPTLPESQFAPWQLARMGDMSKNLASFIPHPNADSDRFLVRGETEKYRAFLCSGTDANTYPADDPAMTMTATQGNGMIASRAFIVDHRNGSRAATIRDEAEPVFTMDTGMMRRPSTVPTAFVPSTSSQPTLFDVAPVEPSLEWLNYGRVVAMTTRCLARFQTVPDCWILPTNNELACKIIGNGMPCLLAQRIVEGLIYATAD